MKTTQSDPPSLLANTAIFANITIVIADTDIKLANLVKNTLTPLGCQRIYILRDGQELLTLMKQEIIDIIITDWNTKTISGIDLALYLRQSLDSPNRLIPIIMLTTRKERHDIQIARDAGVSEYLVKPFSAKALLERVYATVNEPRGFVMSKTFVGPDRRRINSMTLPPDPARNRAFFNRNPPIVVPKDHLQQFIIDDQPRIIMPDYGLRKKMGLKVPPEFVAHPLIFAHSETDSARTQDEFIQMMKNDISTLEENYQRLVKRPQDSDIVIKAMADAAFSIKSRAGAFNYVRACEVAQQLYNFCLQYYVKENKYHLVILEKHIQTLATIFTYKVTGDGGQAGRDLIEDLAKLIHKYMNRTD